MSLVLAIDTSTDDVGIALSDGEAIQDATWSARLHQTATLLPRIDALLGERGLSIDTVGAVAVATGPGSFSGLRVGLSVAKGLVLARDVALIGVSTLEIVARPLAPDGVVAIAVVAAGRGRMIWAPVVVASGERALGEMTNGTPEELHRLVGSLGRQVVLTGDVPDIFDTEPLAAVRTVIPARRAAILAEIGWERWRRGQTDDPVGLEPVYVHPSSRS